MDKMRYLLCLFIYALKEKDRISINTLFRYVYIFSVSSDYLLDEEKKDAEVIIDKNIGIGDYALLHEATQRLNETQMLTMLDAANIVGTQKLYSHVESLFDNARVKDDLNRIMYFAGVISSYSEDVILSVFYNEPNVASATSRNESTINLKNNKLYELLTLFEEKANNECNKDLDKYDVFTTWLNFVFEKYVQRKV